MMRVCFRFLSVDNFSTGRSAPIIIGAPFLNEFSDLVDCIEEVVFINVFVIIENIWAKNVRKTEKCTAIIVSLF